MPRAKMSSPGSRTPQHLTIAGKQASRSALPAMEEVMPEVLAELYQVRRTLEDHYRDMQDIEFTVQRGKLWMLQTRSGKRTAQAALKIAVALVNEGGIGHEEAVRRIEPTSLDQLCIRPSTRRLKRASSRAGSRLRPAPPRARSCSRPTRPSRSPCVARRLFWSASRRALKISTVCTPRRES